MSPWEGMGEGDSKPGKILTYCSSARKLPEAVCAMGSALSWREDAWLLLCLTGEWSVTLFSYLPGFCHSMNPAWEVLLPKPTPPCIGPPSERRELGGIRICRTLGSKAHCPGSPGQGGWEGGWGRGEQLLTPPHLPTSIKAPSLSCFTLMFYR